jgi:hypothetical protein
VEQLAPRILSPDRWFWFFLVALSVGGAGAYGVAIGSWRGGWQPLFTGIKLPAILLLTATGNAFLNSLLAPLLGLQIGFRQSLAAVLASFAISSLILAAAAPLVAFQIFNLPSIEAAWSARGRAFDTIQFTQVLVIAFAGISGNFRLFQLLRHLGGSTDIAQRVLSRSFDDPFKLELMLKDVAIANTLARETGSSVPIAGLGQQLWQAAARAAGPGASVSELVRWVEQQNDTPLNPGAEPRRP